MNGRTISDCMKLKAEKAKALQEKTHLVQGEGSEDQYGFLEDSDMESIDELGFLADVQIDRGSIQALMRHQKVNVSVLKIK